MVTFVDSKQYMGDQKIKQSEDNETKSSTKQILQSLRIIGYDIRDSAAAIGAFKRHFLKEDKNKILTGTDRKILFNLSKKYQ